MSSSTNIFTTLNAKLVWHWNEFLSARPGLVSALGKRFTVVDAFGTPGDTLQTATVCRNLRQRFPRLRINCVTPNPTLLENDPNLTEVNGPQSGGAVVKFWYLDVIERKDGTTHLLAPTMHKLGLRDYDGRARFFLTDEEKRRAAERVKEIGRPLLTLNVQSREQVKTWFPENWQRLADLLNETYGGELALVQLGANDEPELRGVTRLAGKLQIRESVALLAHARAHVGCVSFLMHAANGVDVPSVIIYGGRETPANSGYAENENIYVKLPCSPCWLHDSRGDVCPHDMKCMREISPEQVFERVKAVLAKRGVKPVKTTVAA
ncbi:MAG: glycosyltransferase family 9 protein [Verrucomicrobia bacterium]|nr:glycosyltransferase family 9 protein [Verrucomicrobiota bacterium]